MDYSILITFLKDKENITDLEKDILDTWNELQKNPFDRNSAQLQILQNNAKYPDIFIAIRPFEQATEADIQYNLENQLIALATKEGAANS